MAPFATVTFTIPDLATATAICNAICPGAGLNLAAAKQAVVNWVTAAVLANQASAAQQTALTAVVQPTPITLA